MWVIWHFGKDWFELEDPKWKGKLQTKQVTTHTSVQTCSGPSRLLETLPNEFGSFLVEKPLCPNAFQACTHNPDAPKLDGLQVENLFDQMHIH